MSWGSRCRIGGWVSLGDDGRERRVGVAGRGASREGGSWGLLGSGRGRILGLGRSEVGWRHDVRMVEQEEDLASAALDGGGREGVREGGRDGGKEGGRE